MYTHLDPDWYWPPGLSHAFQLNEKLLASVFETAFSLGNVPWIVVGDLQTSPADSPVLGSLSHSRSIFDLGELFTNSEWTFQKGDNENIRTRIDLALCNNIMLPHITDMTILRNTGLPGHCPLVISFDFSNQLDHKFVFRTPQSIPVKSGDCSEAQVASIEDEIWQPVLADFVSAIANSNVDKAFAIWTAAAEKVCLRQAQTMLQPVGKKHVGRGRKPVVIKTPIQAAPASASTGAATHKLSSLA